MILLKKKQGEDSYFEFDKILSNGYNINLLMGEENKYFQTTWTVL